MKVTCDREKMLAAFQTAAAVVPARSPKPILQNVKLEVTRQGARSLLATDLGVGIRVAGAGVRSRGARQRDLAAGPVRFDPARKHRRRHLQHRDRRPRHAGARRAERVQIAGRKSATSFPRSPTSARRRTTSCPPGCCKEIDPPHDLRHRQRKQPLRPGRRAVGNGATTRSRPSAPTAAGWPRWKARRRPSAAIKSGDSMTIVPTKAMQLDRAGLVRRRRRSPNRRRGRTTCWCKARARRSTRGWSKAAFPRWRDVFPAARRRGQDRADRRPAVLGRAAGGDRHQRRKPRRRFHLRRRHAGAQRPGGRGGPVARRAADRLRRRRDRRSRSTRAT